MRFWTILSLLLLLSTNALGQSQTSSSSSEVPRCEADIRWLNTNGSVTYSRSSETAEDLSFLVHLSRGTSCTGAEVTVTATYLTDVQGFICSGTIRSAMTVSSQVQVFNVAIRPFLQPDFIRWRNQPGARGEQLGKRLPCMSLDGTSDVGDPDRGKAAWMRLSVGVLSTGGGLGVIEALFRLVP